MPATTALFFPIMLPDHESVTPSLSPPQIKIQQKKASNKSRALTVMIGWCQLDMKQRGRSYSRWCHLRLSDQYLGLLLISGPTLVLKPRAPGPKSSQNWTSVWAKKKTKPNDDFRNPLTPWLFSIIILILILHISFSLILGRKWSTFSFLGSCWWECWRCWSSHWSCPGEVYFWSFC